MQQLQFNIQQLNAQKAFLEGQYKNQLEEINRRINFMNQQLSLLMTGFPMPVMMQPNAVYPGMESPLSMSQQMHPTLQPIPEEDDIPISSSLNQTTSKNVTPDELTQEEREFIQQNVVQEQVQEKEPIKAQASVETPKNKAPVAAPKKQQPTYAQKAQESAAKPVTTEATKPKSKYPPAAPKKPNSTFTNKQQQLPRNQKKDDQGFMLVENEEDAAEMFANILPKFHEKRVNGSADYLRNREKETREKVTHPDKNFNATIFIKGVDLGRSVNFTNESTLDEKDEKLSRLIYNVMTDFYGDTTFYINRIWTSPFADTDYECLNISICVFFTKDEKIQIMDKLQQLRMNDE